MLQKQPKILRGQDLVNKHLQDWKGASEVSIKKKYTEKYYNIKHECKLFSTKRAKFLPIPEDSKTYPPRLLLSVFCSKSYDQSRALGVAGRQGAGVA